MQRAFVSSASEAKYIQAPIPVPAIAIIANPTSLKLLILSETTENAVPKSGGGGAEGGAGAGGVSIGALEPFIDGNLADLEKVGEPHCWCETQHFARLGSPMKSRTRAVQKSGAKLKSTRAPPRRASLP